MGKDVERCLPLMTPLSQSQGFPPDHQRPARVRRDRGDVLHLHKPALSFKDTWEQWVCVRTNVFSVCVCVPKEAVKGRTAWQRNVSGSENAAEEKNEGRKEKGKQNDDWEFIISLKPSRLWERPQHTHFYTKAHTHTRSLSFTQKHIHTHSLSFTHTIF